MDIIKVENLTKDYGFKRGVFNVSFNIKKGEVYGFLGPNGAGKSTTIRHLIGFSKPDEGKTEIFGLESFANYNKILEKVGYLPGEISLPQGLTGLEFIDMMKKLRKIEDDTRINDLIELFELDATGDTKKMSLGNKRKLAIVCAFMHDPEVLILDEPTSGLDPVMQDVFINYIKNEKKRGKTILLSSHVFKEVEAVCDRVSIIKHGYIIDQFHMDKLKHATDKEYKITFKTKEEADKAYITILKKQYITDLKKNGNILNAFINDKDINTLIKDLKDYPIDLFEHQRQTLEAYFMKYYLDDLIFEGVKK